MPCIVMNDMAAALALGGLQCISSVHLPLRRRGVGLLTSQLCHQPTHTFAHSIERDMDLIAQCSRGLVNLHIQHKETQALLAWLHERLRRVTDTSFGGVLDLDTIRNIANGLSKLDRGGVSVMDKEMADMLSVWGILSTQLSSLVRVTALTYPSRSLCFFALCDLVIAMKSMTLVPVQTTIAGGGGSCSDASVRTDSELAEFIHQWAGTLAVGMGVTAGGDGLNWCLEAVGGLQHVSTLPASRRTTSIAGADEDKNGGGLTALLSALASQVADAGTCFEHPHTDVPLRINSILQALRGLQHFSFTSEGEEAAPGLGSGSGSVCPDRVIAVRRLLMNIVDKVETSLAGKKRKEMEKREGEEMELELREASVILTHLLDRAVSSKDDDLQDLLVRFQTCLLRAYDINFDLTD
jgi:hypothetical protein